MKRVRLAVCAIIRDESLYIREWVAFHRLLGVERFYLYDDYSQDRTREELRRVDRGDIVWRPWVRELYKLYACPTACQFKAAPQITAFNHWIRHHGKEAEWCAFIDVDEYLYSETCDDLRVAIEPYRNFAGLFVGWLVFGRNEHVTKPPGLTIEAYTRRGRVGDPKPTGAHGKLIVRPECVRHFGPHGSHNAVLSSGRIVDEWFRVVTGPVNHRATADMWRCNHYYNRSEEEARAKLARGYRHGVKQHIPTWERMEKHNLNDVQDERILRFLTGLKASLGIP